PLRPRRPADGRLLRRTRKTATQRRIESDPFARRFAPAADGEHAVAHALDRRSLFVRLGAGPRDSRSRGSEEPRRDTGSADGAAQSAGGGRQQWRKTPREAGGGHEDSGGIRQTAADRTGGAPGRLRDGADYGPAEKALHRGFRRTQRTRRARSGARG